MFDSVCANVVRSPVE